MRTMDAAIVERSTKEIVAYIKRARNDIGVLCACMNQWYARIRPRQIVRAADAKKTTHRPATSELADDKTSNMSIVYPLS